jgi:gamma-glutamyltranspeptidase/glutathione hydrolase
MVATDHQLASRAGALILRQGGNAVDAACAAMFAVGVVNPTGSGIGGGGFMVVKFPKGDKRDAIVIDFRETAPAASTRTMFLRKGLSKWASRTGGLAVGIPGEVRGCAHAIKKYGKLSLGQVLTPAITLAKQGFPVGHHLASSLKRYQKKLRKHKVLASRFYPNGRALVQGQRMTRPALARTLQAIAKRGPDAFYTGAIAKDIVDTVRKAGGILTQKDLKQYAIKQRKPLKATYRNHTIYTMPPPSSGGIAIIQALHILRHKALKPMGHNSSAYLHFLGEALKHAFADRARYLGDPDFAPIPITRLTSPAYGTKLFKRIGKTTRPHNQYGTPQATTRAAHRDGGTSHLSVIDANGMSVALTSTINTTFGSKVMTPQSGIILNNEMDDFTTKPGKPNAFGLLQSKWNEIAPGKRPLSSMSPTILTKNGQVVLSLGASGGPTIITGTLQVMLNVVDFGLELNDAVSRSRIHHQWMPPMLFTEPDLPKDIHGNLRRRGHRTRVFPYVFTAVQAVQRKGPITLGSSDPRKQGKPAGQ